MSSKDTATRRRFFFGAGGMALVVPVTLATASESASSGGEREALEARLAALEDANAIRELQRVDAGRVGARELDDIAIEIAQDRRTASARAVCVVAVESPIEAPGCTLVDMARAQGEGVLRRDAPRVLEQTFVRVAGVWQTARAELREPA